MRAVALLVAFSAFPLIVRADEQKPDSPTVVVDQLDKAFGVKLKSVKSTVLAQGKGAVVTNNVTITLEFTKDVADTAELKKVFAAQDPRMLPKGTTIENMPLVFYLFDKDNVSIGKYLIRGIEGDLTGVKGDAFRVVILFDSGPWKDGVKLEARLKPVQKPAKN